MPATNPDRSSVHVYISHESKNGLAEICRRTGITTTVLLQVFGERCADIAAGLDADDLGIGALFGSEEAGKDALKRCRGLMAERRER